MNQDSSRYGLVQTGVLDIAYEEHGPANGKAVILLHGFPYDVRSFDSVVDRLRGHALRIIVPYLRGYGPTRFLSGTTLRAGEQAALAHDLLELTQALELDQPILCGFDWGGRAACAAAALWPRRFSSLIAIGGYSIYNVAGALDPAPAAIEHVLWYQYYFHGERGARGLAENRRGICRLLWTLWSPGKPFDQTAFDASASSFDNPDFVAVVLSSYRHRFGLAEGDANYAASQMRLTELPPIEVPTIVVHGTGGPLPAPVAPDRAKLPMLRSWRHAEGAGHNVPHEAPDAVSAAIIDALGSG